MWSGRREKSENPKQRERKEKRLTQLSNFRNFIFISIALALIEFIQQKFILRIAFIGELKLEMNLKKTFFMSSGAAE